MKPTLAATGIVLIALTACNIKKIQISEKTESAPAGRNLELDLQRVALAEATRDSETLSTFSADPEARIRRSVARGLGRSGNARTLNILKELARDADPTVVAEAVFAWGMLGAADLEDTPHSQRLLSHPDERVRAATVEALSRSMNISNIMMCRAALAGDGSALVRGEAATGIWRLYSRNKTAQKSGKGYDPAAIEKVVQSLAQRAPGEPADEARWRMAHAMIPVDTEAARAALLIMSNDKNALVRLFAARGLGKRRNDEDNKKMAEFDVAIAKLIRDSDDRVGAEGALAAADLPMVALTTDALENLGRRKSAFARRAAIRSLASIMKDGPLAGVVLGKLEDPSPAVRAEVARAAIYYQKMASGPWETDKSPLVRGTAALGAVALAPDVCHKILTKTLADSDHHAVAIAATAAGEWTDPRSREIIYKALAHAKGLVRENAAEALVKVVQRASGAGQGATAKDTLALVQSASTARGEDLAESLASIISAIETVETARRAAGGDKKDNNDGDLRDRIRVVLYDALSSPDITVRTNAESAWRELLPDLDLPKIMIPGPPAARVPGGGAAGGGVPPFVRAPRVKIITNRGAMEAELYYEDAPVHVQNFLELIANSFYVNLPWHRVEINFVTQGGDHLGDGTGARAAWGGTLRDEINQKRFERGVIGMPKSNVADSGGSQLFITQIPTPHLDGRYTAFGRITSGLEVLDSLEVGDRIESVVVLDQGR